MIMRTVKDYILRWQYSGRIFTYSLRFEIINTQITTLCLPKKCILSSQLFEGISVQMVNSTARTSTCEPNTCWVFQQRFDTEKIW